MSNVRITADLSAEETQHDLAGSETNAANQLVCCDPIITPAYSIPVVNAGLSSVKVALGLVEKHSNNGFIVTSSGINFLVMLGMNLKYTMLGIKGTVSYLRTRKTPERWQPISNTRNAAALALTFSTALTKAGTDAILNRYFVSRLPIKFKFTDAVNMQGWAFFGWTMSGFTFVGVLSSGGMTMYEKLRNVVFGNAQPQYSNTFSRYVSPVIGTGLSLTYAISNVSGTIVSITNTFGITSTAGITGVCTLGLVNAVNSQFTNIPFNVNAVDKFCGSFTAPDGETPAYKDPYTVVSFSVALAAGGFIAYSSRALTYVLLNHSLEILGVNCTNVTDPIVDVISSTTIFSNVLWVGGALTPLLYNAATGIGSAVAECFSEPELDEETTETDSLLVNKDAVIEMPLIEEELPAVAGEPQGTRFRVFRAPEVQLVEEPIPAAERGCGIM